MHAHNHGGNTVRQEYTSVGWGPCSGPLHTGEAYVDDTPYHHRGIVGRLNQPAARIESNPPAVATAQLKNRRVHPSNCLTNFTSGLLRFSLSYIPSEHLWARFLPAASPRTNETQRRPVSVRFCRRSRPAHRDLAGWPVAEGTLPWRPPAAAGPPPRRRPTTPPPTTAAPRRPHHLTVAAYGPKGNVVTLAAAAGPRHVAVGAYPPL